MRISDWSSDVCSSDLDMVIIGVDGNRDAVESIKAGRLDASVAQFPYLVGKQAVEKAAQVLAGEEVETFQSVDTLVLTTEVLEQGTEPMLPYARRPVEDRKSVV